MKLLPLRQPQQPSAAPTNYDRHGLLTLVRYSADDGDARSGGTWVPAAGVDTTEVRYWANWRFLLCALFVGAFVLWGAWLVRRHEGRRERPDEVGVGVGRREEGEVYEEEAWRPCWAVHPAWLLAFRMAAFFVFLSLLVVIVVVDGGSIFYYYTQWTFILVMVYFALGSTLSMHGCWRYITGVDGEKVDPARLSTDHDNRSSAAPAGPRTDAYTFKPSADRHPPDLAGIWGYLLQILYQTNAGAVVLTDIVFWLVMVPFLISKDYKLSLLEMTMHSVNAVFFSIEASLNSLRFPFFRIGYFFLWTATYVVFQWVVHASVSLWWPYPFLDLSSPEAPLWYLAVAVMQVPCYALFALLVKGKQVLLTKTGPSEPSGIRMGSRAEV